MLGVEIDIDAPGATAEAPLVLTFLLHASLFAGVDPAEIRVYRDGDEVAPCDGAAAGASPDPCVAGRSVDGATGELAITVLTSSASVWGFALPSYAFDGFFQPVANPPVLNLLNAGRGVPVKFALGADRGLGVFAPGYPKSQKIDSDSGAPLGEVEETVSAGGSSLAYDAASGRYVYVWKTSSAWKGTCRRLIVRFRDGTTADALFRFR